MALALEEPGDEVWDDLVSDHGAATGPTGYGGLSIFWRVRLPGAWDPPRTTLTASVPHDPDPRGPALVVRAHAGGIRCRHLDRDRFHGRGDVFVPIPRRTDWVIDLEDTVCDVLVVDAALLAQAAGLPDDGGGAVQLRPGLAQTADVGERLWRLVDAVACDAHPQGWTSPGVADSAARLLAAATLAAFPHDVVPDVTAEDRRGAHPATLEHAILFIETNADQPIGIGDVARAAGTTPRAVQLAFRRYLGTTPMGYLRQVRLERAHADLVASDPSSHTVTGIAGRWGFAHTGRFAAQYASAYGVRPSATLAGP